MDVNIEEIENSISIYEAAEIVAIALYEEFYIDLNGATFKIVFRGFGYPYWFIDAYLYNNYYPEFNIIINSVNGEISSIFKFPL
jgi:hypothetical protein